MGNIISYLQWRGDLSFMEQQFCDVDNVILSELSYYNLSGIVPAIDGKNYISVEDAAELYYKSPNSSSINTLHPTDLLEKMAASKRFRNARLFNYIDIFDEESQTEFSALHIMLDDGTIYVSFRGTGDSILGWREDFSMSYQIMPAQRNASTYLDKTMTSNNEVYRIGGHSKGGNLAVYASMMCSKQKRNQIIEIYNNDGSGLCREIIDISKFNEISHKIIRIIPEYSIVGMLYSQDTPTKVISSSANGIMQHSSRTWNVEGDHFCEMDALSEQYQFINSILKTWIESADMDQKKVFTKDFFDALEAGGSKYVSKIQSGGIDGFESILVSMVNSEKSTKNMIGKLISSFLNGAKAIDFRQLIKTKSMIRGAILFLVGLVFMMMPEVSSAFIGIGVGIVVLLWLGKKQVDCAMSDNQDRKNKILKLIIYMALMCILVLLISQKGLLTRTTNLIMGVYFLVFAFRWLHNSLAQGKNKLLTASIALISIMLGIVPIVTVNRVLYYYIFTVGTFVLIYGIGLIIAELYKSSLANMGGKR